MNAEVMVIVPQGWLPEDASVPAGCRLLAYHSPDDVVRALFTGPGPAVLVSDHLHGEAAVATVAAAIRSRAGAVIEVRSERWDGFTPSPLSAACCGVISGFGIDGLAAAVKVFESGQD